MTPNVNRTSPVSVIDLSEIYTISGRDYDLAITETMFRHHFRSVAGQDGFMCEWYEDILLRLDRLRRGLVVVWIPDCNTGVWTDVEEWFVRYGYAPDMIITENTEELARILQEDADEMTASITIGSYDTDELSFSSLETQELSNTREA